MSFSSYLTTKRSNLAGLSAVAYGDSDYFRYVQNQIIYSKEYRDLYRSRPSQIFYDLIVDITLFEEYLEEFSDSQQTIRQNKLIHKSYYEIKSFERRFIEIFSQFLDQNTIYDLGVNDFFDLTFRNILKIKKSSSRELGNNLRDYLRDNINDYTKLEDLIKIILNNPNSKIYDVEDNAVIQLKSSALAFEYNSKGLNNTFVEIPIQEWEDEYIYRNTKDLRNRETPLDKFFLANFVSYSEEHLRNPGLYNGMDSYIPSQDRLLTDILEMAVVENSIESRIKSFSLIGKKPGIVSL
jgi:hypothetical protein